MPGGFLVEAAHRSGAHRGVEAGEYIEDYALAIVVAETYFAEVFAGEIKAWCHGADGRDIAVGVARGAVEINSFHYRVYLEFVTFCITIEGSSWL